MTDGKRECVFSAEGVVKICGYKATEKKKIEKTHQKVGVPMIFVKGNYFGTSLCTTCKINEGDDKDRSLRKRGGHGRGEGGGADTRRKGLKQDFI